MQVFICLVLLTYQPKYAIYFEKNKVLRSPKEYINYKNSDLTIVDFFVTFAYKVFFFFSAPFFIGLKYFGGGWKDCFRGCESSV